MRSTAKAAAVISMVFLFLAGHPALAQVPPEVDPERIREGIRQYVESLPEKKLKLEGISLKYKKVPGEPAKVINEVVDKQWRDLVKQYAETVKATLHSLLEEAGTLKTGREITFKKKKVTIPPGEYTFGVYIEKGVPAFIGISGKGLEDPVRIPFRSRKAVSKPEPLKVEGAVKKKGRKKKLQLVVLYGRHAAKLPDLELGEVEEEIEEEEPEGRPEGGKGEDDAPTRGCP